MVFFTCNACGESLKKAQVDKHVTMCRGCQGLSCIDCGKDFWGDDYKSHVKCVSEDQKYGGKRYEAKTNKGDLKQQQWIQRIQEAMNKPGMNPKLRDVLKQVSTYDNVPRKKVKFQNWMKNSLRIFSCELQDQVWEIFSTTISRPPEATETSREEMKRGAESRGEMEEQTSETRQNKRERKEERQKKKRREDGGREENGKITSDKRQRRKIEAEEEEDGKVANKLKKYSREEPEEGPNLLEQQDGSSSKGKFNWKGTIKAVLRQAPDEGLTLKKLRKKVLATYYSVCEDRNYKSEEELFSVFNKKMNNPRFKILRDKVRLVQ